MYSITGANCDAKTKHATVNRPSRIRMERVKGIEPSSQAWEARILPMNYTRIVYYNTIEGKKKQANFINTQ